MESTETTAPATSASQTDFRAIHSAAMTEVAAANETGIKIHNKRYTTVAKRVEIFRRHFGPLARLKITDSQIGDNAVRMTAVIELRSDTGWELVAEGRAEEVRTNSGINSTSALEVCETSAYGRALANFGLHGGEFASANEVEQAISQQNGKAQTGDRSGRPDTSKVDPDMADQYAQLMYEIMQEKNKERAHKIHVELCEDEALYTAAMDIFKGICKSNSVTYPRDKWAELIKVNKEAA